MLIESFIDFFDNLTLLKVLTYFWPFFLFDMTRYLLLELLVITLHIPKLYRQQHAFKAARKRLFRDKPLVSVISPGKDEGKHIQKLINTLGLQTYKNIESIIVDDGSEKDILQIGRNLQHEGKITLFIRNEIRGGKASAANTALRYAKGKFVIHIDTDSYLEKDSIEKILIPFFMDDQIGAVGGDIRVANIDKNIATRLQAIEYYKSISIGRTVSSELGVLRIIAGAYGAFRKDVIDKTYGWDVGPGLDGDLTLKIRKLGYKVIHAPFAVCYTNTPDSFLKLARQRYRWDRSLIRFRVRKHVDILLPSKKFSIKNFLASIDNIFFNLLLDIKWWIYIVQLFVFGNNHLEIIFLINLFLYGVANFVEYGLAVIFLGNSMRTRDLLLFIYLPLMPIYTGLYLRAIRSFAYFMEFTFRTSYFDKWNPWKVSKIAKKDE